MINGELSEHVISNRICALRGEFAGPAQTEQLYLFIGIRV